MTNTAYCHKHCELGKMKSKELLANNNSAYDAAIDFCFFVEKCYETCKYKEQHEHKSDTCKN